MAKAKKEFKARVRKMQKHIKVLLDLAATALQREGLYRVQGELDQLQKTHDREFDEENHGTPHDLGVRRETAPTHI